MARLNEPPVSADTNFELLRRKFLRQNRDIAKINSDQSQKIRRLENDCACLLSENLELRGQIIRLEKQLEDNSARRIADHALEIKAKLEEQLAEFGALLGNLGMEPPAKRHSSSESRRHSKPRQSSVRSPPARRRRDTNIDPEALAAQEGRLPPIYENKSYPRATMNSDEILALCAAAADTSSDSLELGPPPVSRFIEEIPIKHDSPTRKAVDDDHLTIIRPPKLDFERKAPISPEPSKKSEPAVVREIEVRVDKESAVAAQPASHPVAVPPVRAGAKRKYGDENNVTKAAQALEKTIENATSAEKNFPSREIQKRRSIKEIPANRRRQPLAAKSTNEDVSSPKKTQILDVKDTRPIEEAKDSPIKGAVSIVAAPAPKAIPKTSIPPPVQSLAIPIVSSPSPATDRMLPPPTTPLRSSEEPCEPAPHDTPPPAHISSEGETSRPSRRARSAVSYAEPNLRDKMRRPTKELFDAVSGLQRRPSLAAPAAAQPPALTSSAPISVTKPSAPAPKPRDSIGAPIAAPASPTSSDLQSNVVFDRRRSRPPTILPPPLVEPTPPIDVYDFQSSTTPAPKPVASRPSRKSSMAAQAALHKILDDENNEADTEPAKSKATKTGGIRKHGGSSRSSTLVSKRTSMMDYLIDTAANAAGDTSISSTTSSGLADESTASLEDGGLTVVTKGKVAGRRRSMMI
ncbi:hypothetical protein QBC42DRAFT_203252 [Cladorrhinum samala]|uniref:Shugoshin n=1 Tax=Cladorrhinum samala TaxID=585594 RepID=A0AAV9HNT3_9PEZI|nr:hypothetical protein QBC42DRAFT_203252 [Cladorrhinum samala]